MCQDIIDLKDVMERVQDDKDLLLELFDIFTEDYREKREQLKQFIDQSHFDGIKDIIHSLKGATGNISAMAMHATCEKIEQWARQKDIESIRAEWPVLEKQFQDLQARIVEIKNDYGRS